MNNLLEESEDLPEFLKTDDIEIKLTMSEKEEIETLESDFQFISNVLSSFDSTTKALTVLNSACKTFEGSVQKYLNDQISAEQLAKLEQDNKE